ncbi:hypothetical protein SAMN00017405_1495 [Desulfonispora thiosulfatigenes DSM 11270]|uniref:Uncharacterized protein n=1 Tax=Desulfonispora thiosulfatigenes DSM 11270 TaxID=656914 RepID=A0A1W1VSH2_DESTI|nr:hypothetical protein [Desulfonispora thiosulfatigenes]SMB96286.1 hypothetical protein SAMN00017405_1495 [Desulfonispora thiosulfatigenes DSM 11270]
MFKKTSKLMIVFGIMMMTLGILLFGYFFYEHQFLQKPLTNVLDNNSFIEKYELNEKSKTTLKIKVSKVDSFPKDFQDFMENSASNLLDQDLALEIYSNPNSKLNAFYQDIHPAVYEAQALGNFVNLQEKFNSLSQDLSVTNSKLTITNDYLFLQIEDGEYYLYKVFRRQTDEHPTIINNIGSDKL